MKLYNHLHSNNLLGILTLFELIERNGASPIEETFFFFMCYLVVLIGPLFLLVVTPFLTHKIQKDLSSYVVFLTGSDEVSIRVYLCYVMFATTQHENSISLIFQYTKFSWTNMVLPTPITHGVVHPCLMSVPYVHERRHMSIPYCENKSCKSTGVKWKKQAASHAARQTIKKKKFMIFFASPKS